MKITKYILLVAAILTIIATVAWVLRKSLIQEISNQAVAKSPVDTGSQWHVRAI